MYPTIHLNTAQIYMTKNIKRKDGRGAILYIVHLGIFVHIKTNHQQLEQNSILKQHF